MALVVIRLSEKEGRAFDQPELCGPFSRHKTGRRFVAVPEGLLPVLGFSSPLVSTADLAESRALFDPSRRLAFDDSISAWRLRAKLPYPDRS
jgi:hypothetical protein